MVKPPHVVADINLAIFLLTSSYDHLPHNIVMRILLLVAVIFTTSQATSPVYSSPHHIHADSGRDGHGPHHVNRPFPARLLSLCEGIASHGHSSGPTVVGHMVFRVGASIVCDDLAPAAAVVGADDAPADEEATDAPTDA